MRVEVRSARPSLGQKLQGPQEHRTVLLFWLMPAMFVSFAIEVSPVPGDVDIQRRWWTSCLNGTSLQFLLLSRWNQHRSLYVETTDL